jgi:GT2 family glycosyltransferase
MEHSTYQHQLLIHVNDGSDGSLEWARNFANNYPKIHITHSPQNIGICHAVNWVGAAANEDFVVYMNDDMVVSKGWDEALLKQANIIEKEHHTNLYCLSATMVEPKFTRNPCVVVHDLGDDITLFNFEQWLAVAPTLARDHWQGSTWPPTLVRTEWWHKVGGYSSEFSPGMSSDNDFSAKLWDAGCRIFMGVGDSLVYHFQCKSTGKIVKNPGGKQFLQKWGMTQSNFDKQLLKRGQPYRGKLNHIAQPSQQWQITMKAKLKLLFNEFGIHL